MTISFSIETKSRRLRRAEMRDASVKVCKRDSLLCQTAVEYRETTVGHGGFHHPTVSLIREFCTHCKRNVFTGAKQLGPLPRTAVGGSAAPKFRVVPKLGKDAPQRDVCSHCGRKVADAGAFIDGVRCECLPGAMQHTVCDCENRLSEPSARIEIEDYRVPASTLAAIDKVPAETLAYIEMKRTRLPETRATAATSNKRHGRVSLKG